MCLECWSTDVKFSDFVMSHPRVLPRPLCLTCGVTHLCCTRARVLSENHVPMVTWSGSSPPVVLIATLR